jgi:hypothetical protein
MTILEHPQVMEAPTCCWLYIPTNVPMKISMDCICPLSWFFPNHIE